jgi:hypothetical protein
MFFSTANLAVGKALHRAARGFGDRGITVSAGEQMGIIDEDWLSESCDAAQFSLDGRTTAYASRGRLHRAG